MIKNLLKEIRKIATGINNNFQSYTSPRFLKVSPANNTTKVVSTVSQRINLSWVKFSTFNQVGVQLKIIDFILESSETKS